jgi:hypothetical protein
MVFASTIGFGKGRQESFGGSRSLDTPLSRHPTSSQFLYHPDPQRSRVPQAAVDVSINEERGFDDSGDLTDETTAQIGSYAHRGQDRSKAC